MGFDYATDKADGVEEIEAFCEWKLWRIAGKFLEKGVGPEQDGHIAQLCGFFKEAQVARTNVIERTGDDDLFLHHRVVHLAILTFTLNAPATGSLETTIR